MGSIATENTDRACGLIVGFNKLKIEKSSKTNNKGFAL